MIAQASPQTHSVDSATQARVNQCLLPQPPLRLQGITSVYWERHKPSNKDGTHKFVTRTSASKLSAGATVTAIVLLVFTTAIIGATATNPTPSQLFLGWWSCCGTIGPLNTRNSGPQLGLLRLRPNSLPTSTKRTAYLLSTSNAHTTLICREPPHRNGPAQKRTGNPSTSIPNNFTSTSSLWSANINR